jgi:hypothetical protein
MNSKNNLPQRTQREPLSKVLNFSVISVVDLEIL